MQADFAPDKESFQFQPCYCQPEPLPVLAWPRYPICFIDEVLATEGFDAKLEERSDAEWMAWKIEEYFRKSVREKDTS